MAHIQYLLKMQLSFPERSSFINTRVRILIYTMVAMLSVSSQAKAQFVTGEYRLDHLFTADQLREDLTLYKTRLEHDHPNLYLYTPKVEINRLFDSLYALISAPDNSINFYNMLTRTLPAIKDGHTQIFPDPSTTEYENQHAPFLPLKVHWEGNRLFVIKEYSTSPQIAPGAEILVLNGVNASYLHDILMRRQIRDGFNTTYPAWIIDRYFASYYSFHFGNPAYFNIQTLNPDKTFGEFNLKGLSRDSIAYYRQSIFGELSGTALYGSGLTLNLDTALSVATISIRDFHNDILRKDYDQRFDTSIPAYFRTIRENKINSVVLDLRNNQGGDIENAVTLLSYLLDTPFDILQSYETVDPATWKIPEARLQPEKGPYTGKHPPAKNNFTGNLYILINGGTFSASSMVCSALQANKRGVFIGEETGGNPIVLAGNVKNITLPNTKTSVSIPTVRYNIRSILYNVGRGIIPDYPVVPSTGDILHQRDAAMEMAFKLINGKG